MDQIYHLACPASPPHYQYNPIKTIKTSTEGTMNMLGPPTHLPHASNTLYLSNQRCFRVTKSTPVRPGLAKRTKARMLLTSTSEIYGDPEHSPQHESYWWGQHARIHAHKHLSPPIRTRADDVSAGVT